MNRLLMLVCAVALGCAEGGDAADADGGGGVGGEGGTGGTGAVGGTGGRGGGLGQGGMGGGNDGNSRPELKRIGDREAPVGATLEIKLEASDPENDPIQFNVRSSLPDEAKFDKVEGLFTWTPTPAQDGTIVLITFEATDGSLKDQETIQISVVAAGDDRNRAPAFEEVSDQILRAGQPFELKLVATDANGDELTYSFEADQPLDGATVDAADGTFRWTPPAENPPESVSVTFRVSDGELDDSIQVKLVVRTGGGNNMEPDNLPPRIRPIGDREARVGERLEIQVEAEDDNPDSLQFAIAGVAPQGSDFDRQTALFAWTPAMDQANQAFPVVFQVSDGEFRAIERVTIQVVGMGGGGDPMNPDECPVDDGEGSEPNPLPPGVRGDRSLCPEDDTDTYTVSVGPNSQFTVTLNFTHASGDIDMRVLDPRGALAGASGSARDMEQVTVNSAAGGDYEVEVFGFQGAANPDYSITLVVEADQPPPMGCQDDGLDNHLAGRSAPMRDNLGDDLQICGEDEDFFHVELDAGTNATIEALFVDDDGDIDMVLSGPDDFERRAVSGSDNEVIALEPVPATGRYTLRVYGFRGMVENGYRLRLTEEGGVECAADRVEPNDAIGSAEPLRPELYRNLTWCGEPDWYKTEVDEGSVLNVWVSYDGEAPNMEAFSPQGASLPDQSYGVGDRADCQGGRDRCFHLRVPAPGGWIHYSVTQGEVGQEYDLDVEVEEGGGMAGECGRDNQSCDILNVCDYRTSSCAVAFCDRNGEGCPPDYECHQEWCVEPCDAGGPPGTPGTCGHDDHVCKHLDGDDLCGVGGNRGVGAACFDFSDCDGSFDCLTSAPNGYCSRECNNDMDCGGGEARCGVFPDGNFCGKPCDGPADCRADYSCGSVARPGGGQMDMCVPGIEV